MASSIKIDFLPGKVSSFEEFFAAEDLTKSVDFNVLLDAFGSIPLYEWLGIKKELLSSDELSQMTSEAMESFKMYQHRIKVKQENEDSTLMNAAVTEKKTAADNGLECQDSDLKIEINDDIEDNGSAERFLKCLYNTKESDLIVTTLQKNIDFAIHPKFPEKTTHDNDMNFDKKDMQKYLADIYTGKYDNFAFRHPSPTPSSSESESDEEVSSKAREFSSKFKIPSNTNKFDFLKIIVDDSLKKVDYLSVEKEKLHFHPPKWISSDEESEMEQQGQRINEQEMRRKKKIGRKNRNITSSQSKQKPEIDKSFKKKHDDASQEEQNNTSQQKLVLNCADELKQINSNLISQEPPKDQTKYNKNMKSVTKSKSNKKTAKKSISKAKEPSNTVVCVDKPKQQNLDSTGLQSQLNKEVSSNPPETECNKGCWSEPESSPEKNKPVLSNSQSFSTREEPSSTTYTDKNEVSKGPILLENTKTTEPILPHINQSTSDQACNVESSTLDKNSAMKLEQETLYITSSSSDEDWSAYAERGLSAIDKILNFSSKKLP